MSAARQRKPRTRSSALRRKPRRAAQSRRWLIAVALGLALLVGVSIAAAALWSWGGRPSESAAEAPSEFIRLEVTPDEPLAALSERLATAGLVPRPALFTWYKRVFYADVVPEPGAHWLRRGTAPRELLRLLGRRQTRPSVKLTLPEGWDSFQMAERVAALGVCSAQDFLSRVHDATRARAWIGHDSFEGYLHPATYEFRLDTPADDVVYRLVEQSSLVRQELFGAEDHAAWLRSAHELVTLASIVQKEAANDAEMPLVASVFRNRLSDPSFRPQRMLQSDPTAGYGCKLQDAPASCRGYAGSITAALLKDSANRFNTYRHAGLPPGPIGNPGRAALRASAAPAHTPYFFFVLGPDKTHRFSVSYEEHKRHVGRGSPKSP